MKKLFLGLIIIVCLAGFFALPASACFNIKYVHQGVMDTSVMDFTIVLQGERVPINVYLAPTGYRFTQYTWWFDGGYTYIKWFDPVDPAGIPVDPIFGIPYCTWMYIGWELGEPPAPVIAAYWTDLQGNPLWPWGVVKEMWHNIPFWPDVWLWLYYNIEYESAGVDSVYYKVLSTPLTLDQMNWENPILWPPWEQMTPLYIGTPPDNVIPLAYGDSTGWAIPGAVPGDYVVFVYRGFCNNIYWDFGQHIIEEEEVPVYDLWETPVEGNTFFEFGCDPNPGMPALPADFFGPGSDPFDGGVPCVGEPLETSPPDVLGPTDTIVRRARAADMPTCPSADVIETEIVALNLVSITPITVTYWGGLDPEEWDVRVCLSDVQAPPGTTNFTRVCDEGGTFASQLYIYPKFIFNKVSDPSTEMVYDYGTSGLPPIEYYDFYGPWMFTDPGFDIVTSNGSELVSRCWNPPDMPIGASGVDLIPGLEAIPCGDCVTPAADYARPLISMTETFFCAQQEVQAPSLAPAIPTLGEWGLIILALLILSVGTIAIIRKLRPVAKKEA